MERSRRSYAPWKLLGLVLSLCAGSPCRAGFTVDVSFNDPGGAYSSYYDGIRTDVAAAGAEWGNLLDTMNTSLKVEVDFANIGSADGRSALDYYSGQNGNISVYTQGAAAKVIYGVDVSGTAPEAFITLDPSYLNRYLYFDPSPTPGTNAVVPADKVDAYSVFLHEFGHILAFNGFRDGYTGSLPGNYESTVDKFVTFDGTNLWFNGPHAEAVYGGPVPLTYGDYFHVGNYYPRPGFQLDSDLMYGPYLLQGRRYDVSPLDLAIFADSGLPLSPSSAELIGADPQGVPEPASLALLTLGVAGLLGYRRWAARPTRAQ